MEQYNLLSITNKGWVYMEVRKEIPGLKQAGKIINIRLTKHLAKYSYAPVKYTPAIWRHETRTITFIFVVENFGVKYVGKHHAEHLIQILHDL